MPRGSVSGRDTGRNPGEVAIQVGTNSVLANERRESDVRVVVEVSE